MKIGKHWVKDISSENFLSNNIENRYDKKKYVFIDCLKGIAVIMIFFRHCVDFTVMSNLQYKMFCFQQFGAQLFIVISGFLAYYSLCRIKPKEFYIRRLFSLIPSYWIAIIIYSLINYILVALNTNLAKILWIDEKLNIKSIGLHLFLLNGFSIIHNNDLIPGSWYVGTIVILYAVSPILFKLLCKHKKYIKFIILIFLISLSVQIAISYLLMNYKLMYDNGYLYLSPISQIVPYFTGMVVADYIKKRKETNSIFKQRIIISLLLFVACLIHYIFFPIGVLKMPIIVFMLSALFGNVIILCYFLENNGCHVRIIFLECLGRISYEFYLFHFLILYYLEKYLFQELKFVFSLKYFVILFCFFIVSFLLAKLVSSFSQFVRAFIIQYKRKEILR